MPFFLYFLIIVGYAFTKGFFSFGSEVIILFSCVLFFLLFFYKFSFIHNLLSARLLLVYLCLFSILLYGGLYQTNIVLVLISYFLLGLNFILALRLIFSLDKDSQKRNFLISVFILLLLRLFMIWSSPDPHIDVYDYLKYGALGFLSGKNPYELAYTKLYANFTPNYYGYLPGMLYITLPFVAIFRDPRYTFVLAELITALLILKLTKNKDRCYLYSILFLNNPISLYLIEQSYTEPLILSLLVFLAFLFTRKKNLFMMLVFGLTVATKQYLPIILPALFRLLAKIKHRPYIIAGSLLTAGVFILPFFLWNPSDFIQDAIFLQHFLSPRYEGLSFFSLLFLFGIKYNFIVSYTIIFLICVFVYSFGGKRRSLSGFFYLSSFTYFVFFFFNKWSFINYYYLISQLLLAGIVVDKNSK